MSAVDPKTTFSDFYSDTKNRRRYFADDSVSSESGVCDSDERPEHLSMTTDSSMAGARRHANDSVHRRSPPTMSIVPKEMTRRSSSSSPPPTSARHASTTSAHVHNKCAATSTLRHRAGVFSESAAQATSASLPSESQPRATSAQASHTNADTGNVQRLFLVRNNDDDDDDDDEDDDASFVDDNNGESRIQYDTELAIGGSASATTNTGSRVTTTVSDRPLTIEEKFRNLRRRTNSISKFLMIVMLMLFAMLSTTMWLALQVHELRSEHGLSDTKTSLSDFAHTAIRDGSDANASNQDAFDSLLLGDARRSSSSSSTKKTVPSDGSNLNEYWKAKKDN